MTSVERIRTNNAELEECITLARNIVSGGGSIKLYKFNDTIDENGSFNSHELGEANEEFYATIVSNGMKIKNLTVDGEFFEQTSYFYPAIIEGTFYILFYNETVKSNAIYVSGNGFLVEIESFEIVDYGTYEEWFKANTVFIGSKCPREHVIEVTELPTDNIDKTAVYAITNKKFTKVALCLEGLVLPDALSLLFEEVGNLQYYYVAERPTENVVEGVYYILSEKDVFVYNEFDGWISLSWAFNNAPFKGVIDSVEQVTEEGYYAIVVDKTSYYKYQDKYFKDIVIFDEEEGLYALSEAYDGTGLNVSIGYSIVPTIPTKNIVPSGIFNYELFIFHFYYIEDANEGKGDILLYFQGEWTRAEELFGTINGIVKDISEITEEGVYAVMPEGFVNYILPEGSIIVEEPGRYNVAPYDSVVVKNQPKEISGAWRFNDDVASFGSTQQVNFTTFHKGEIVKCVAIETELDDFGPQMSYHLEDGTVLWNLYNGGWGTYTDAYSSVMMTERIIDFGKEEQKVPGAFKEWLLANAMPYEKSENLYVRNLYELPEDADDGAVAFVLN